MQNFINRSKYRMCISSIQQLDEDSIEFFLSTQTRSGSKASQSKFLQDLSFVLSTDLTKQMQTSYNMLR